MAEPVTVESSTSVPPPPPEAPPSIAAHEQQLADLKASETDATPVRHRAVSQFARAEDVPKIAELTKELRQLESDLGLSQQPGESNRLYALRRQVELGRAAKAAKAPTPAPAESRPAVRAPMGVAAPIAPADPGAFTEKEPALEDFATATDQYGAYLRAAAAYDRRKEAWDGRQQQAKDAAQQAQQAAQQQQQAAWQQTVQGYNAKVAAFEQTTPDFKAQIDSAFKAYPLSDLALVSLMRLDNGPAAALYLAKHLDVLDELHLLTEGKPVTDAHVALVQRRLTQRMQAASTGSAAPPVSLPSVPRPPNPVRTGPQTPGDTPPGDGASLADHERYWGPCARR